MSPYSYTLKFPTTVFSPYRFLSSSSSRPLDLTASSSRPTRRVVMLFAHRPLYHRVLGQFEAVSRAAGKYAVHSFRHLDAEMIVQTCLEMPSSRPTRRVLIHCP